jgi:hypothetical protein
LSSSSSTSTSTSVAIVVVDARCAVAIVDMTPYVAPLSSSPTAMVIRSLCL